MFCWLHLFLSRFIVVCLKLSWHRGNSLQRGLACLTSALLAELIWTCDGELLTSVYAHIWWCCGGIRGAEAGAEATNFTRDFPECAAIIDSRCRSTWVLTLAQVQEWAEIRWCNCHSHMIRITHFLHSSAISGNLPPDNLDTMTRTFNHIVKITTIVINQRLFPNISRYAFGCVLQ